MFRVFILSLRKITKKWIYKVLFTIYSTIKLNFNGMKRDFFQLFSTFSGKVKYERDIIIPDIKRSGSKGKKYTKLDQFSPCDKNRNFIERTWSGRKLASNCALAGAKNNTHWTFKLDFIYYKGNNICCINAIGSNVNSYNYCTLCS